MIELRCVSTREDGCFSVLKVQEPRQDGRPFAVSVDRTFENMRTVLRNGIFRCVRDFYHHGGYPTFKIIVPDHDLVLFHKGNKEVDSKACVCVAESFDFQGGVTAVADSKHGFEEFMRLTAHVDEFPLIVSGR